MCNLHLFLLFSLVFMSLNLTIKCSFGPGLETLFGCCWRAVTKWKRSWEIIKSKIVMPPWDFITNPFLGFVSVRNFYHFYFICRFFFSFLFGILKIGSRDYNMYKISDCHLSFVSAAVTVWVCFMFWNSWNKISCLYLSAIQVHVEHFGPFTVWKRERHRA